MPITSSGKKVMKSMVKSYGAKKAKEVFYASINKKKKGTAKWHGKKKAVKKDNKHYFMAGS
jgi:hypothetical protein